MPESCQDWDPALDSRQLKVLAVSGAGMVDSRGTFSSHPTSNEGRQALQLLVHRFSGSDVIFII